MHISESPAPEPPATLPWPPGGIQRVQYWGGGPQQPDEDWERRRQWRAWRRQQDEPRIAEAARREAMLIEQEREQPRAWWRAKHEQEYGYSQGYYRSW